MRIGATWDQLGEKRKALATILNNIGAAWFELGEKQKALEYYEQALSLSRAVGDRRVEAQTLLIIGLVYNDLKQLSSAIAYGKLSINLLQQLRITLRALDKDIQQSFLKSYEGAYTHLSGWLMATGRLAEAQQALRLGKDQEFYD